MSDFFRIILLFLLTQILYANETTAAKHILVLHSYNKSMTWEKEIDQSIEDTLEPTKNGYILHTEYMDTKRIFTQEYINELVTIYKIKYKNVKFDLLLSSDNNAFDFLRKHRDSIFGEVPTLFSGVNFFKDSDLDGYKNYSGVAENFDAKSTLTTALKLFPNTKKVYVINDYLTTGRAWKNTIQTQLKSFENIQIIFNENLSMEDLKAKIGQLPKDSIVLLGVYFTDKNSQYYTYERVGKILSSSSKNPVFCLLNFNIHEDVIGGDVISGYYQGKAMSEMAQKVLSGVDITQLEVIKNGATKSIYNWDGLKKYGIESQLLKDDSLILNKPISFYEEYKYSIYLILFLLVIIIVLFLLNYKRKIAQNELRQIKTNLEKTIQARTNYINEQKEYLENFFNTRATAILLVDKNQNILDVNPTLCKLWQFSKEEIIGKNTECLHINHESFLEFERITFDKDAIKKSIEYQLQKKDGSVFWAKFSGESIGDDGDTLWMINDITNEKEALDNFTYLFNNTIETIGLFQNGKCIKINEAAKKMFGFKNLDDAVGMEAIEFIAEDSHEIVKKHIADKSKSIYEANAKNQKGVIFPVLIKGEYKVINGIETRITLLIDLSDLKQKEKALEIEKIKAEEATKMKSEFLANMSHEIRTPMNGIIGMTHLALQTKLDKKQRSFIEKIGSSSKNLLTIINDILDFSKAEAGKLHIEKIDFLMTKVIKDLKNIINLKIKEKGLTFNFSCDNKSEKVFFGDPLRLGQILINLTNNAIKFTEHGSVSIEVNLLENDRVRFSIVDTGIGIKKEKISTLFEAFTQADGSTTRKYGGSGLGLSISKQLIELMNGELWVESEVGVGSKFIFEIELPKGDINNIAIKENRDLETITSLSGSQILLVEDNIINQEIIIGLLESSGIKIDIANNGKEAVLLYESNSYELILMDLQMPIMDGYEATKIIREKDKEIPIIALTANAMKEDSQRTKNAGMNEHLNKPLDVEKLYETLLKYIYKKVDILEIKTPQEEELEIPNFVNIDSKIGLKRLAGNKKLYLKVLCDFRTNYNDLVLETLGEDEQERVIHTLKGLSANIGATNLNTIIMELEKGSSKALLQQFYEELHKIIDELKALENIDKKEKELKIEITDTKKSELFLQLKEALKTQRPKKTNVAIEEIQKYKLDEKELEVFEKIVMLSGKYKFKDALLFMEERLF